MYKQGYKEILIIYKIHSFYFYEICIYYALVGSSDRHGDRLLNLHPESDTHGAWPRDAVSHATFTAARIRTFGGSGILWVRMLTTFFFA